MYSTGRDEGEEEAAGGAEGGDRVGRGEEKSGLIRQGRHASAKRDIGGRCGCGGGGTGIGGSGKRSEQDPTMQDAGGLSEVVDSAWAARPI